MFLFDGNNDGVCLINGAEERRAVERNRNTQRERGEGEGEEESLHKYSTIISMDSIRSDLLNAV